MDLVSYATSLGNVMTTTSLEPTDIGTIYCVGRNYAAHAKELNNPIPKEPVIFVKARSTACHMPCEAGGEIDLPLSLNRCDHETEIVIRLGADLTHASPEQALAAISHYGMALDLTLREKQTELKRIYAKIKPIKTSKRITKGNSKDTTDNGKDSTTKQGAKASEKG